MKFGKIILVIVICGCVCFTNAQTTFEKTYGWNSSEIGTSVKQTSDGGFIITGTTNYQGNDAVGLVKTDSSGNQIWINKYTDGEGYSVVQTNDGNYVIAGRTPNGSGGYKSLLVKINADGNLVWSKTYADNRSDAWGIVEANNNYVTVGRTEVSQGNYDVFLLKTDTSGGIIFYQVYNISSNHEWGKSVITTKDNGFIISGEDYTVAKYIVIKTDSNGILEWDKNYSGGLGGFGFTIRETLDSNFLVLASYENGPEVLKISNNGTQIWKKWYSTAPQYGGGNDVYATSDNGFILTGYIRNNLSSNKDIYLIKANISGDTLWTKRIGRTGEEMGNSVLQMTEGSFVIAGYTTSIGAGGNDVYLIKTDSLGNFDSTSVYSTIPNPKSSISIFPNPNEGKFKIQDEKGKIQSVEVYNVFGEKVFSSTLTLPTGQACLTSTSIDLSNHPAGIYFLQLFSEEETFTRKIIKE